MRWLTPICGAASPAPFFAAMVSFMSWSSSRSSGVANFSTGRARSRSTGWPMRRTSRTDMALHHLLDDEPDTAHRFLDDAADVDDRHAARTGAAPRGGIHHDRHVRIQE